MEFHSKYNTYKELIETYLDDVSQVPDCPQKVVFEAMRYSLTAGGKRIRPVFMLAFGEMFSVPQKRLLPFAAAIEMIHTYSLIHDDLPAMDNDDLRRGKPTCHKVYGEDIAILAGDGLLTRAFEIVVEASLARSGYELKNAVTAMKVLADYAGCMGMIAGQTVDLQSEHKEISAEELEYIHINKTGALIKASCVVPAVLAGNSLESNTVTNIENFAQSIGLLFQIKDDILDVESCQEALGKPIGSDKEQGKNTFATLYGCEKCKELLNEHMAKAIKSLDTIDAPNAKIVPFIKMFVNYLYDRVN